MLKGAPTWKTRRKSWFAASRPAMAALNRWLHHHHRHFYHNHLHHHHNSSKLNRINTSLHLQMEQQLTLGMEKARLSSILYSTRSLGALRAPTSSWRPFGPLDFVLRALRALRPVRWACLRSGPPFLTIFDHLDHFRPFGPFSTIWTIFDHFRPFFLAIFDHFAHFSPFCTF